MDWLALVTPPLIWANAAWVQPFLKTYRHRLSGMLSLAAGGLMFAALRVADPTFHVVLALSGLALAAMFASLLWPPRIADKKADNPVDS